MSICPLNVKSLTSISPCRFLLLLLPLTSPSTSLFPLYLSLPPLSSSPTVIEKYTENTRFCLICNYLSKIIPALQSRCTRFRFGPLSQDQMIPRLEFVIQQERWGGSGVNGSGEVSGAGGGECRLLIRDACLLLSLQHWCNSRWNESYCDPVIGRHEKVPQHTAGTERVLPVCS